MRVLHVDGTPFPVCSEYVVRVNLFDVPTGLRARAAEVIDDLPMGEWFTLGKFLATGETVLSDTAVVRRTMRAGRVAMEYGIEC